MCYKFLTGSGVIPIRNSRYFIFWKQKKRKMENCTLITTLLISSASLVLYGLMRVVYVVWWRPKSLEKQLRQQGIQGTSFNLLQFHGGDMRKMAKVSKETWSKPMTLNHHIAPYVLPSSHQMVQKYGKQLVHEKTHTREKMFSVLGALLSGTYGLFGPPGVMKIFFAHTYIHFYCLSSWKVLF